MTTSEFVKQFRESDPRKLALQASRYPDVDMPYALTQIQGWQTALRKLPSWAACDGVVYPPHLNMEQCSSEATARYKQQVARRWAERIPNASRTSMTDLTGGFGVDFSFTSRCFDCATYVERNASLCEVVGANLPRLGIRNAQVKCAEAEAVLKQMEPQTMIFLDPARRDEHGAKTVLIADCTPDVCQLLPRLMQKSQFVMLKLSPMLDWHKAIVDLDGKVREVHIVSADGECKELLLVLAPDGKPEVQVFCVDILSKPDSQGVYPRSEFVYSIATNAQEEIVENNSKLENSTSAQPTNSTFNIQHSTLPPATNSTFNIQHSTFLFEPNASVMKAGCFDEIARAYGVSAISRNSHLFLSDREIDGFPGRSFAIDAVTTMNKRQLRQTLSGMKQANIAVRNFPLSVAELRKRLKLNDGGDTYIFATTTSEGDHILMLTHKTKK
ncbi:SAM-dependent methyltransferase [uncultured Prevotella sp.]|uniref:THUMP-like domain-containing protein n=1 Tax=uncultured Prevotella sp. TaxID=159272 RepID=UPI002604498D|nr:SAM-dependent methyltransferase [uncultured Prevotella sp.]